MTIKWCLLIAIVTKLVQEDVNVEGMPTCQGKQLSVNCECHRDKKYRTFYDCDCSNRKWAFVHKGFPKQLSRLVLQKNLLTFLNKDSFQGCDRILMLDLAYNNLTSIAEGTFDEMTKLQDLIIENNNLKFTDPSSVPNFMLRYNSELEGLRMQNNNWFSETDYNSKLFYTLKNLRELQMDGIDGAVFDDNFKYLKNLKTFSLTGGIKTITNDTFKSFLGLKNVKIVSIIGGQLDHIDELAFSYFANLRSLDLSGNMALTFKGIKRALYGLSFTQIQTFILTNIETGDSDTIVDSEFFYQFRNLKKLKELNLSKDNIIKIDFKDICKHIPNLDILDISKNSINRVKNLNDLANCTKCSYISAEHQSYKIPSEYFLQRHIALPPNVTMLMLQDAFSFSQIISLSIEGGHKLQKVDLKYNGIKDLEGPISFSQPCDPSKNPGIHVDLQSNNIFYFYQNSIDISMSRCIKTLSLSNNKLGEHIRQMNKSLFQNYENLETLSLSTNGITYIQPDLFVMLRSLIRLHLQNNHLNTLFEMKSFSPNYIYLAENDIEYLTMDDRETLDESNRRRSLQIDLYKNPFICTCGSYPFLQWLISTPVKVTDWESNKCKGQDITLMNLAGTILPHLYFNCHVQTWLIIGGSSFVGIVALTILGICVYRKRWCLKYWCIKAVRNQKRHQLLKDHDTRDLYQYDAFVMYAGDDSAWVAHNLVPNLESRESTENNTGNALKLCVHQRDFLGGVDISENIVQAIDSSFKCLVILSRKFCKSEWTNFEIQMARTRSNAEGRNVIIVIRLEDVPLREMSTSLIYVLQNHTYIDYPQNEEALPGFWEKVKNAINDSG